MRAPGAGGARVGGQRYVVKPSNLSICARLTTFTQSPLRVAAKACHKRPVQRPLRAALYAAARADCAPRADPLATPRQRMDINKFDSKGRRLPRVARIGLPSCRSFPWCRRIPAPLEMRCAAPANARASVSQSV